jgi:hypothetical protein
MRGVKDYWNAGIMEYWNTGGKHGEKCIKRGFFLAPYTV